MAETVTQNYVFLLVANAHGYLRKAEAATGTEAKRRYLKMYGSLCHQIREISELRISEFVRYERQPASLAA